MRRPESVLRPGSRIVRETSDVRSCPMSMSCPALARRRGPRRAWPGLIGAVSSGARGCVARGMPIASSSHRSPSCQH